MTYTRFAQRCLSEGRFGIGLAALSCTLQMPRERDVFGTGASPGYDSSAGANGLAPAGGSALPPNIAAAGTSRTQDRLSYGGRRSSGGSAGFGSAGSTQRMASAGDRALGGRGNGGSTITGGVPATRQPTGELELVAHFGFDETTGEIAVNSADSTKNAKYIGSCDHPAGRIDGAVSIRNLNGISSDWVELPQRLLAGLDEVTVSVWVRDLSTTRGGGRLFDFAAGADNELYFSPSQVNPSTNATVSHLSGKFRGASFADFWTTDARISTGLYSDWHHVALAWSATQITLYIDGEPVGTQAAPGVLPRDLGATTTNWLGRTLDDEFLALYAEIDDLRVFGRALGATEIARLSQIP